MARQKRTFANNSELIHIWANQAQDEGCSGGMSFSTRHIYSYGRMIACFKTDDIIFLNNLGRSSTTSRHQSAVRNACRDLTIFEYNTIPNWCAGVAKLHEDPCDVEPIEIWQQYRDIWSSLVTSAFQRRFKRTASQRLDLANEYAEKAHSIAIVLRVSPVDENSVEIPIWRW